MNGPALLGLASFGLLCACAVEPEPQAPPLAVNQEGLAQRLNASRGAETKPEEQSGGERAEAKPEESSAARGGEDSAHDAAERESPKETQDSGTETREPRVPEDADLSGIRDGRRERFLAKERERMTQ